MRVVREAGLSPPALRPEAPGVECWRDVEGAVVAYAARLGDAYQVDVPCVGRFRFTTATPEVVAHAEPSVRDALVHEHYFRANLPLALQVRGFEVLHASAVETAAGVVAFAAPKESGKSTLAFALSQRGHRLWADDAVVF
ncbi:MAG TPA: hypothetical protein VI942_11035, partial [Thermoanaerobaculia bacterium]|nr:hypothetical protein [Thermoanaerobaculia bacterium]